MAKQAAKQLFGSEEAMIRLDMSEYMTDNAVVRLIGNDERKGDLTEKIKKNPYSLVLLDELEKAHPDVWALYLQMLDDGHLTDGRGRKSILRIRLSLQHQTWGISESKINISPLVRPYRNEQD